jgi:hypothetical protein
LCETAGTVPEEHLLNGEWARRPQAHRDNHAVLALRVLGLWDSQVQGRQDALVPVESVGTEVMLAKLAARLHVGHWQTAVG